MVDNSSDKGYTMSRRYCWEAINIIGSNHCSSQRHTNRGRVHRRSRRSKNLCPSCNILDTMSILWVILQPMLGIKVRSEIIYHQHHQQFRDFPVIVPWTSIRCSNTGSSHSHSHRRAIFKSNNPNCTIILCINQIGTMSINYLEMIIDSVCINDIWHRDRNIKDSKGKKRFKFMSNRMEFHRSIIHI